MEKAYWLKRKRASIQMAQSASCSAARLAHYDLAGRYGLNAVAADMQPVEPADSRPPALYASRSDASLDEADNG